jgi:pimeloyl-ACP methyl ester carboxylesterase
MTSFVHDTAPTQYAEAGGIRFAYRRFGIPGPPPLVFFQHFMGTMDDHDPALSDAFASDREVILFNNAGVASTTGTVSCPTLSSSSTRTPTTARISSTPDCSSATRAYSSTISSLW